MQTSWDGIKFICRREALVTVAYKDGKHDDGSPKYSIGFGSQTPVVAPGDTITVDDAFVRMMAHVDLNDADIRRNIKVAVKQCEWDAVASLYYQEGFDALKAVAGLFMTKRSSAWAIREFANWHKDSDGLLKRRLDEIAMARGHYGDLETYKYFDGDPETTLMQSVPFPAQPMRTT